MSHRLIWHLDPRSKLATARCLDTTTLPELLDVHDATDDELYDAMDWLLEQQERIEGKLAKRHLANDSLALYDLSSSYFEGRTCPLAALGYNRDGKRGELQVNYGLLTDRDGRPTALKPHAIRKLVDDRTIQKSLFDERHLAELEHPDFPGERLVVCRNPELAKRRAHSRLALLEATSEELTKVVRTRPSVTQQRALDLIASIAL